MSIELEARTPITRLPEGDQQMLGASLRGLLQHGSILREKSALQADMYDWCRQNRDWLEDTCRLLDLRVVWEHESRLIQAIPQSRDLLKRLRLDETLILLALWYDYDTQVRDLGNTEVKMTVLQVNESLLEKFQGVNLPSQTRLRDILRMAEKYHLIEMEHEKPFENSRVCILPTLRHVIPFPTLEEWNRVRQRYLDGTEEVKLEDLPGYYEPEEEQELAMDDEDLDPLMEDEEEAPAEIEEEVAPKPKKKAAAKKKAVAKKREADEEDVDDEEEFEITVEDTREVEED